MILILADESLRMYRSNLVMAIVLRLGSYFLAWLFACFTLGAIASVVNNVLAGDEESTWSGDGYEKARERLGPLAVVASLTVIGLLIGIIAVSAINFALLRVVGTPHFRKVLYWGVADVGYLIVAWLLSRFGLAIPLLIRETISGWQALRESVEITRGYGDYLFLLVGESAAGSFVASLAIRYGFDLLRLPRAVGPEWFPWIYYPAVALASASVQPLMFIGFSVLSYRSTEAGSVASIAQPTGTSTLWPRF